MYKFSKTSLQRMVGVHPDLIRCAILALQTCKYDFLVGRDGGVRTLAQQKRLLEEGKSKTMESKHLPQHDGFSHAIDLWVWHEGKVPWKDKEKWIELSRSMMKAAEALDVKLVWGGDWDSDGDTTDQLFNDYPHFELGE